MTLDAFEALCSSLRIHRGRGGTKPYKPLMLLAVVTLIGKGKIDSRFVFLDGALRSVFEQLLDRLFLGRFPNADARYPFRHLASDGIWRLVPTAGLEAELMGLVGAGAKARDVLLAVACAELDAEVFAALRTDPAARRRNVLALCSAWSEVLPRETLEVVLGVPVETMLAEARPPSPTERLSERALEEHLVRAWARTPFAALGVELASRDRHGIAGRQTLTPVSTIDLLGYRASLREWWVLELKKGRPSDVVVGQVSRYMGWIGRHHARPEESCVGAIISRGGDIELEYAVRANPRLSLWHFDDSLALTRAA